jgi:hypothetical protein
MIISMVMVEVEEAFVDLVVEFKFMDDHIVLIVIKMITTM